MAFFDWIRWNSLTPTKADRLSRLGLGQLTQAEREYEAGNLKEAAAHCEEAARLFDSAAAEQARKDG